MNILVLTQPNGILRPFAIVLGFIMNYIYKFLELFGIRNVAVAIILFTLAVDLIMIPLTVRQQKSTKLSAIVNPEVQKIQKKYGNRRDEESMRKMQAETQAVYDKYGYSAMGGCLPLLIQLPILFALYRVIYNVPAFVESVRDTYNLIAVPIFNCTGAEEILTELMETLSITVSNFDVADMDKIIDFLYAVKTAGWDTVAEAFSAYPEVFDAITQYSSEIVAINALPLGMNIVDIPVSLGNGWRGIFPGVLIPALAGFSQWLNMKVSTRDQPPMDTSSTMGSTMNTMNLMMPFISVFFCLSLPSGIGLYWIASSVFRTLMYLIIDVYLGRETVDDIIEKNKEKAEKKAEKRGEQNARLEEYAAMKTSSIKPKTISELANTSVEGKGSNRKSLPDKSSGSSKSRDNKKFEIDKEEEEKHSISGYAHMLKRNGE